jgi:hypothetical protein
MKQNHSIRYGISNICCLLATLLCQLASAGIAFAGERAVVREVLVSKEGNGARIEIRASQPLTYRSYLMSGLEKWVVDLPGAKTTYSGEESKKVLALPLERITVKPREVNGDLLTRIGLDFKGSVDFSLTEDPLNKGHLVITMTPSKSAPQMRGADPSRSAVPQQ